MGIWDEVNTIEEMTDVYERIHQLEDRCQQLEDICLRVASLQQGFYKTKEEADHYFPTLATQKETPHQETMVNFVLLAHLYRRIDLIQNFYHTLQDKKHQPIQEELFQHIRTMLHSVIASFNMTLDIVRRLARRNAVVYMLGEDIPVALMVDDNYLQKYYLEEEKD